MPTKEEKAWMSAIAAYGCIACRLDGNGYREAAVHHLVSGNRRMGHMYTIPLCQPGHHMDGQQLGMISRHPWKARFEARYGSEMALLEKMREVIR